MYGLRRRLGVAVSAAGLLTPGPGLSAGTLPATSGAIIPEALASTGATQSLVILAGLALFLGGLALSFSAPRRGLA